MYGFAGEDDHDEVAAVPGQDAPALPPQLVLPARLWAMLSGVRDWPENGFAPASPAALRGADVAAVTAPHAADAEDHAALMENVMDFEAAYLTEARTDRARRASLAARKPSVH